MGFKQNDEKIDGSSTISRNLHTDWKAFDNNRQHLITSSRGGEGTDSKPFAKIMNTLEAVRGGGGVEMALPILLEYFNCKRNSLTMNYHRK